MKSLKACVVFHLANYFQNGFKLLVLHLRMIVIEFPHSEDMNLKPYYVFTRWFELNYFY